MLIYTRKDLFPLIDYLGTYHQVSWLCWYPSLPMSNSTAPHLLGDFLTMRGGKFHFLLSIYSLEHGLNPSGQDPKGGWIFLSLHPPQWSSIEENCEIPRARSPTTTPLPLPPCCELVRAGNHSPARGRTKSQI